jgi:tripeptide aminopeptidase
MDISKDHIISEFQALVAIDSPSFGEREKGDYLKKRLTSLGLSVAEDDAGKKIGGNCGNIYGFLDGRKDLEPILFCAHMDTVEPSAGKRAVIRPDGIIKARRHRAGRRRLFGDYGYS